MRSLILFLTSFALLACGGAPPACGECASDAGIDASTEQPDGGPPDSGPACAAGPIDPAIYDCASSEPGIAFGEAITAEARTWTFVAFPDALCMDGSATGIGVNLNPESDRVVIYLDGGGACFDPLSCLTVANQNGFDARDFASYVSALDRGLFARDDEDNPLRDASYVFVPYCTGDVHGGTNESGPAGRRHLGYRNVTAYLSRLVPTFASASHVLLTGRSAGGLGTLVNYEQVQRAFDCTPVDLLDDGGALLSDTYLRPCLQARVREVWGLDAVIPDDCPQCSCSHGGGLSSVLAYLPRRYPDRRFGLITSLEDATFRSFYGYGYSPRCDSPATMPGADYAAGLEELREELSADTNIRTFYLRGEEHTFTYRALSGTSVGGVTLSSWIEALVEGDASWSHAGP